VTLAMGEGPRLMGDVGPLPEWDLVCVVPLRYGRGGMAMSKEPVCDGEKTSSVLIGPGPEN